MEVKINRTTPMRGRLVVFSTVVGLTFAGAASATVTEYTSQSLFATAVPAAKTFGFDAHGRTAVIGNPSTLHNLSFADNYTAPDAVNSGFPLLFLVPATDTPTYGVDFLTFQNTDVGVSASISSAGVTAIGFDYGSYNPGSVGDAIVTLSTGDSFTITPTSTAAFIGFASTTPITSITIDYPGAYSLDLTSITAVPEAPTWAMMLMGFGGLGLMARRRRRPVVQAV